MSAARICAPTIIACSITPSAAAPVIVQYNKMEFNQAEYGPYPAKVSGNRVSDEMVPVKVLVPGEPGV